MCAVLVAAQVVREAVLPLACVESSDEEIIISCQLTIILSG